MENKDIEIFNTLIDVVISNFYQDKAIYEESLNKNTIKNINYGIKPQIKKWHIDVLEPAILDIMHQAHNEYNNIDVKNNYKNEFEYLCVVMTPLKKYIYTSKFLEQLDEFKKNHKY